MPATKTKCAECVYMEENTHVPDMSFCGAYKAAMPYARELDKCSFFGSKKKYGTPENFLEQTTKHRHSVVDQKIKNTDKEMREKQAASPDGMVSLMAKLLDEQREMRERLEAMESSKPKPKAKAKTKGRRGRPVANKVIAPVSNGDDISVSNGDEVKIEVTPVQDGFGQA